MANGSTNCFVEISNISSTIHTPELKDLLECFGPVKQINMHQNALKERVCVAEFGTAEESRAATSLSGTKVGGMAIRVRQRDISCINVRNPGSVDGVLSVPMKNNQGMIEADRWRRDQIKRTIYVGNLNHHVTEDHVRAFFKQQGAIKFIKMSGPGMDNPYCFIEFFDATAAQKAINLNGSMFHGRPLRTGRVKNPVGITGVERDILNNPVKLSLALNSAKLALQKLEQKKKQKTNVEDMKLEDGKKGRKSISPRRNPKRARSRSYSSRSRSSSWRRRSSSRSRRKIKKRRRLSRSRSNDRRRGFVPTTRRRSSYSSKKGKSKKQMVWDGFNWHPLESREGQATKIGQDTGAKGPKVGNSPGYILGQGFMSL